MRILRNPNLISRQCLTRPLLAQSRCSRIDGVYSTEHYWWLAYEWKNINPACGKCNKFKGSKFPVQGARARPGASLPELAAEDRLLIGPFNDDPEDHLEFLDNGPSAVASMRKTRSGGEPRCSFQRMRSMAR